jgi:hypothetical protein
VATSLFSLPLILVHSATSVLLTLLCTGLPVKAIEGSLILQVVDNHSLMMPQMPAATCHQFRLSLLLSYS